MDLFGDLPEPDSEPSRSDNCHEQSNASNVDSSSNNKNGVTTSETTRNSGGLKRPSCDGETAEEQVPNKAIRSAVKFHVKGFVAERQGEREEMQDAHVMIDNFTSQFENLHPSVYRLAVYAVYDGHGGARASRFASQHLHKNLRDKFPKGEITSVEKDIKKIVVEAFKKTDEAFLKEATKSKPAYKDGTTVAFVLIINDTLYTANLGDSQIFLCRRKEELGKCVPVHLTTVHNPSAYQERIRIQKAGGNVKDGRVMGVLEVSRSIGDGQYKKHGVSCTPDIKKCNLSEGDRYLVIACDGLWTKFNPEECINFTNSILEDTSIQGPDGQTTEDMRFEAACNKLANSAVLRLSSDNVTVILVSISPT